MDEVTTPETTPGTPAPDAGTPAPDATVETPPVAEVPAGPDFSAVPEGDLDPEWVKGLHGEYAKASDAAKRLEEWGGADAVSEAMGLKQSLTTEAGVVDLFIRAGTALGLGVKEMEALFGEPTKTEVEPEGGLSGMNDDDVLTVAQVRELLEKEVLAPQREAQEKAKQDGEAKVLATAQQTVSTVLGELGVTDDAERRAVLAYGEKHIANGDYDPDRITEAIRKGKAEYDVAVEKKAQAYLAAKAATAEQVPSTIGGGNSPGGTPLPEPKNTAEAIARARARIANG